MSSLPGDIFTIVKYTPTQQGNVTLGGEGEVKAKGLRCNLWGCETLPKELSPGKIEYICIHKSPYLIVGDS